MHPPKWSLATFVLLASTPSARADLTDWLAAVGVGTAAGYVTTSPTLPTDVDIGVFSATGGTSYEFIVNADNTGVSSALMGVRAGGVADNAGFKFEQWPDTMQYGLTRFGIVDHSIAPNVENQDVHLVFVCDTTTNTTELFINGVSSGSAPDAVTLSGMVGIGHIYDVNGTPVDPLTGTIHGVAVYDTMLSQAEIQGHSDAYFGNSIGTNFCVANANSTGAAAAIVATGSNVVSSNSLTLTANNLPNGQFGYFLNSLTQGFIPNPGGSQGNLCLTGGVGRYNPAAGYAVQNTGSTGSISLVLDLASTPTPGGPVAIAAGETWNFQCWYRDLNPSPTSNFTDGVSLSFQ